MARAASTSRMTSMSRTRSPTAENPNLSFFPIFHSDQKQPFGWSRRPGLLRKRVQVRDIAFPGLNQRAHQIANHVFQEAASPHAVDQTARLPFQGRSMNGPNF